MTRIMIRLLLILSLTTACVSNRIGDNSDQKIKLLEGLGGNHFPISTTSPLTQRYFDQGLILAYAFNHWDSERSFRQALVFDPGCAVCYWGIAWVLGPNINAAMEAEAVPKAYQAAQKALELSSNGTTAKERDLISALALRYRPPAVVSRSEQDASYADAMRVAARKYSGDPDVGTVFAEGLMNQHPWDYWTPEGKARPWTGEIVATLENILMAHPLHPGANHLYIHAVEASDNPERALESADRLRDLVPGAGHLVHMPAHIYIRTGRYQQAITANRKAVAVDSDHLAHNHTEGIYPLAYVPHNHHFLWAAASNAGHSAEALAAAKSTAAHVDTVKMRQPGMGTLEHYYAMPLYAQVRFGQWDVLLDALAPEKDLRYVSAIWHYARGMAFVAGGDLQKAGIELNELQAISGEEAIARMSIWEMNTVAQILEIAQNVLAGEIAGAKGDMGSSLALLRKAVKLEDKLRYNEPSDWYFPVRQSLGAVLLKAMHPDQAEQVYRQELKKNPENGWSLFGLMSSLKAQNKEDEAAVVRGRFEKAWTGADIILKESRLLQEK